jgi:competence protein ComEA
MKKWIAGLLLGLCMSMSALAAVNLNTATQSELEAVKGIGPAKARDILAYREKNGPFKSLDDLANVKGFGKTSVQKLKDQLTVGEAAGGKK